MKKIIAVSIVCVATAAFAFGGGGHARKTETYEKGVDIVRAIFGPDPIVPPDWVECDEDVGKWVPGSKEGCCLYEQIYTDQGIEKCCDEEGLAVQDGKCEEACELPHQARNENGECVCANGYHDDGAGGCTDYCAETNGNGECISWLPCPYANSGSSIVGVPNVYGVCAEDESSEVYCSATNGDGECEYWGVCPGTSTGDRIIGVPNASGACVEDESSEVYCNATNGNGECVGWGTCYDDNTGDRIIGVPNAYGVCAEGSGIEVFCYHTNGEGMCDMWSDCYDGTSTGTRIIGMPDAMGGCVGSSKIYCEVTDENGKCTSWAGCEGVNTGWDIIGTPDATGICCEQGEKIEGNTCAFDACADFKPTTCRSTCSSAGGEATYTIADEGTPCGGGTCNGTGTCVCSGTDENYFSDVNGECVSCNVWEAVSVASKTDCHCANRLYFKDIESEPYYCRLAEDAEPFSNCETAQMGADDTLIRGYLPSGTPCETAGVAGTCDDKGQCVPQGGTACTSNDQCSDGWFCNAGGATGGTETPDICEKIQYQTFTHNNKTYYYNTKADFLSWCRTAPSKYGFDCRWGYLTYVGAQNWCAGLGKRLLTCEEFFAVNEIIPNLPRGTAWNDWRYWVQGGSTEKGDHTCPYSERLDGFIGSGGMICTDMD